MSNTLRITTVEVLPQYSHTVKNWHPIYAQITGKTPCYNEFMQLIKCLQEKGACKKKYENLLECLAKEGF